MTFRIRPGDPARERATMLSFIDGLQAFEHALEPNRRLDGTVAADHMGVLEKRMSEHGGAIFLAEDDTGALGWSVVYETVDDLFIVEAERRMAYIAELYLVEHARGQGAGGALIQACEDWAKSRGIGNIQIGVLARNVRAHAIYNAAGYADYSIQLRKYL